MLIDCKHFHSRQITTNRFVVFGFCGAWCGHFYNYYFFFASVAASETENAISISISLTHHDDDDQDARSL